MANNPFLQSPIDAITGQQNEAASGLPPMPETRQPSAGQSDNLLPPDTLRPLFENYARKYDVPVNVLMALGHQESRYRANAVGTPTQWGRARGLMQYLDSTAQGMGINPFDPEQSIDAAAKQIRQRLDKGYSMEDAVKEHFAGPDRKLWGTKTDAYGREVLDKAGRIGELFGASSSGEEPQQKPMANMGLDPDNLQKLLDEEEPGRFRVMTPDQVAEFEADKAAKAKQGEEDANNKPFLDRITEGASRGLDNTVQALTTAKYVMGGGGDSIELADALSKKFLTEQERPKTTGEKEIDTAFQRVTDAEGAWATTKEGVKAVGTALANPKDLAVGITEQAANMLPTLGGGVAGAGGGAAIGAGAGAAIGGVGAAPGAVAGAIWGGRAGMVAGTTATELGAETEQMIAERLQEAKLAPTPENIKAILDDKGFVAEAQKRGLAKGLTVAVIDQLFLGLSGKIATAPTRAAAAKGVTASTGSRVAAGGAAVGVDAVGEVVGEAASQKVARGEVDAGDALREGVYGFGQSIVEPAAGAAMNSARAGARAARGGTEGEIAREIERNVANTEFQNADQAARDALNPDNAQMRVVTETDRNVTVSYPAPSDAPGPLTRAAENATPSVQGSRVSVTTPAGKITGFMEDYYEFANGTEFTARVLGDDGQVYNFNSSDNVQIEQESGPLAKAVEQVAATEPQEAPAAQAEPEQAAPQEQAVPETAAPEPIDLTGRTDEQLQYLSTNGQPGFRDAAVAEIERRKAAAPRLEDMDEAQLRERVKYIAGQAKNMGGWNKMLTDERRKVESEINRRKKQQEVQDGQTDNAAGVPVRDVGATGNQSVAPEQRRGQAPVATAEVPAGAQPANTGLTGTANAPGVPGADQAANGQPALNDKKRTAALKRIEGGTAFFGTDQKAQDFIAKNGLADTHEVVQTGKVRFDVKPKGEQSGNNQRTVQQPDVAKEMVGQEAGQAQAAATQAQEVGDADAAKTSQAVQAEAQGREPEQAQTEAVDLKKLAAGYGYPDGIETMPAGLATTARKLSDALAKGDVAKAQEILRPENKRSREAFASMTGVTLPKTVGGTNTAVAEYIQARADTVSGQYDELDAEMRSYEAKAEKPTKIDSWINEFERAKSENDTEAMQTLYSKVRAALNGIAQRYGKDVVKQFEQLKKQIEDYAKAQAPAGTNADLLKAAQDSGKLEILSVGDKKPAGNIFANNKIFTQDKVEAARARLKSKLSQLNSGIDPEVLIDGMTIAGAYIEGGVREFSAYSKAMIEDFGDKIKPYLLSFYEGARNYPGLNTEGMSSVEDAKRQHAAMITPADIKTEAVGEIAPKPAKRTKKTGAKSDMTLTQDWGVDAINGYSDDVNRETGNTVKDAFLKETRSYLNAVAGVLTEQGYTPYTDAKGRPDKMVSVNESGVSGSGDVTLTLAGPDGVGAYVHISDTSLQGVVPTTPSGIAILFRTTKEGNKYSGGRNQWAPVDLSAADLAALVDKAVKSEVASAAKQPTITTQEKQNDTEPSPQDTGIGAEGQAADGVRADAGGRDAGAVSQPAGRADRGTEGGSPRATGERPAVPVNQRSDAESAGSQQPAQGGRGSRAATGDRGNRQPGSLNYRIQPGELKREGSWRQTAERNVEIVELIKRIDTEGRQPTEAERKLMTRFTGWGASEIANGIFPDRYGRYKDNFWQGLGERLKAAMTPEEYDQAKRTTQYAHYTSEGVIRSIYSGLDRLGFKGGNVLEPGMGTGLFNGLMPDGMAANTSYTGIEYDTITGKIAQALYPESNVIIGDFTRTNLPKDFFDAAIGNPPFSQTQVLNDPEYKSRRPMLHDYFFMKTIDRVKPGGVVVFVTSKGTMDKTSDKSRKYLADRANLLGAIRLPQTAFKDNAGTEVVTDVIFLQKRGEGIPDNGVQWLNTKEIETPQGPTAINEYFVNNPPMVLGSHALTGSMYRANEYTVIPQEGVDIEQAFNRAVQALPKDVHRPQTGSKAARAVVADRDFNPKHKKEGGLYLSDAGSLMQVEDGSGVEVTHRTGADGKKIALAPKQKKWLRDFVGVRDALKQTQYDQLNDGDWEKSLKALNKSYDAFVKEHGPILDYTVIERKDDDGNITETKRLKNAPLFQMDVEGALAYALEVIKEDGTIEKGPALKERVLEKPRDPEIKTTQDALFVSLNRNGALDIEDVAKLAGTDPQSVIEDLGTSIYDAPGAGWQLADEYLSGNVVRKLKEAQAAAELNPKYKRNLDALLAVQPAPLGPTDITVRLGANWVPASDIAQFASEVIGDSIDVSYNPVLGSWSVSPNRINVSEWGFNRMSSNDILEAVLNSRQIKVTYRDSEGKTHTDVESTEKANDIAAKMRERFRSWVWTDPIRAERLVKYYNENFNNIAPRKFDGSHLTLPGVSSRFKLYPHQKRAVWRVVQQGDTYLAHAVGAGKTMEMIAAGMEERRLGLIKKPMYVVPNHMLAQFSREFLELYPAANIMVADEQNFGAANRRRFVAQAALNNPDAIVITHSAFGRISMSDEFSNKFIQDQIDAWTATLEDVDKGDRITVKQIERRIEQLERRLEGKQGKERKDKVLNFEELGVDRLFVDEFHEFRKLDFPTNQGNVKGVDPNGSQRALDLYMKVQYLREKKPGRSLVAASGTPVTNTMGELFTAQRFFQPEQLAEDGNDTFDAWSAQYGDIVTGFEQNAAGGYEMVNRFAKFQNVPELMRRVRSFMDILTSNNLGELVKRPDVIGGGREVIVTPVPEGYKEYQQELQSRIQRIRNRKGPPKKGDDIILSVISDGRFSAIDMRFVDPSRPSDPNSKLNLWIDDIIKAYQETADYEYADKTTGKPDKQKGSSIIGFSDIGLGEASATNRGFDMRAWIEKRLTEAGIPADQVAFMRDYKQHAKKERLFADMREGKKRILIGGKEMETGTNVQKRLTHLFHLDAPWFPASVEQREGRIIRQGNQNKEVKVNAYATKGSYDSTMWGMNARKARFIEQAMNGDDSVRSMDDVSEASAFEMASALASGDERYLKLAGLKTDVERLERLRQAHYQDQNNLRREKHRAEDMVSRNESRVKELETLIAKRTPIKAGEFLAKVGNRPFDNRDEFSQAIFDAAKKLGTEMFEGEKTLGEIGGFDIIFYGIEQKGSGNYAGSLNLDLPGDPDPLMVYPIDPGMTVKGIAARAANQVNGLDRDLEQSKNLIKEGKARVEQIGKRMGAAFPEEAILMEKVAELNALEAELAAESETANAEAAAATQEIEGDTTEGEQAEPKYSVRPDGVTEAEFGPVYTGLDTKAAIDRLMDEQTGEAIIARDGLGDVSLVYGNSTAGLKHITGRHGDAIIKRLPALLQNGNIYTKEGQPDRVFIGTERDEAVLRLDWNGTAKTWLLSAYEKYPSLNEGKGIAQSRRAGVVADRTQPLMDKAGLRQALRRGVVGSVLDAMVNAGVLVLHNTNSTLPKAVRNKRGVQAVTMPDGTIHMVANSVTPQNAQAVLLHEAFHMGGERLIGTAEWGKMMGRLGTLYRQSEQSTGKAREFFDKARARVAAAKKQGAVATRMEVEEFAAYAIEEYSRAPESLPAAIRKWVEDLIGLVKAWAQKRYGKQLGKVTPAQLSALAKMAIMDVAAERRGEIFGQAATMFSATEQTNTPAFKRWFNGSKVVDANGNPLVVYHGTTRDFSIFNPDAYRGQSFFTDSTSVADTYARGDAGSSIYPVYLSIKNPFEHDFGGAAWDKIKATDLPPKVREKLKLSDAQSVSATGAEYSLSAVAGAAQDAGYDGVIARNLRDGLDINGGEISSTIFVVTDSKQIKSATGNNGNFDPTNPDIRFSVTPEQGDKAIEAADKALTEAPVKDDYIGRVVGDIGLSARLIVHPRQIAAIHPEFTPVYRTAISQMETRDTHIAELGRDVAAYDSLPQEGKERVNKLLELGRLMSMTYTADELQRGVINTGERTVVSMVDGKPTRATVPVKALLSGQGEVITLTPDEAKAYTDLRKMFDRALDMMRDQTLTELGFEDLVGQPNAAKAIRELITDQTPAEQVERLTNIAKFVAEIEQAKRAGYVPFARYGDYVVTVKEKVADVNFLEDDTEHLIAQGLPDSFADSMLDMGATQTQEGWRIKTSQKRDVERLTEKTVYSAKVETGLKDFMDERKAKNVEDIPAVRDAIAKARSEYVGNNPNRRIVAFKAKAKKPNEQVKLSDVDALAEVTSLDNATWDMVREALADAIKAQGFRRHFFHSDNVPGYTGDFERSIADYVIGMSGYLSRRQHMKQWDRSVSSITTKPKLFEYASNYRDYVNNPQEELAIVRQIGFFSYIAGVAASAFANLTQVPFLTIPTLSQVAPVPLVLKETVKAYKDALAMMGRPSRVGLDMFDPNKAPADVRDAIKEAWDEGVFVPLESFDLMMTARQRNVGRRKLVKGFNTGTQVVAIAFTFAERLNRLVTFIAASRLANKRAVQMNAQKVLAGNALAKAEILGRNWSPRTFAEWAVDESQFRMGKANRPTTMRGVGSAIMQFKGFMLQTFESWYRMAALHGKSGKFAAAASIMTLYAFAGLWGLPGADDLRKLLEAMYKQITDKDLDMKTELRAWIARTSGSNALAQMVSKGLAYPTGLDLTRVGLGSIVPDSPLAAAGIPFDMLIGRPKRAFEKASAGDNIGAVAELTPNFIKHWLVAGGWAFDGVRDKRGNLILTKDELTGTDVAMKALGFQPSIVTDVRDYEYAQRRAETAVDGLKRSYTSKIARAIAAMDGETDKAKLRELDQRITEIYADIDDHNAKAQPEQVIRIDQRALRNRIQRELDGVKSTWGRERKQARGAASELRGVFGLAENDE